MPAQFSLVVCTRNRREQLLRLLESVREHCAERVRSWEVLVVNNASTDDTASAVMAASSGFPMPLSLVEESRTGIAFARNCGLAQSSGGVIVFVDDDVTLEAGYFVALEQAFSDEEVAVVGGRIQTVFPLGAQADYMRVVKSENCGSTGEYDLGSHKIELVAQPGVRYPHGGNSAFRRSILSQLAGFNTELGWGLEVVMPGEETEFYKRALKAGYRILYEPRAAVLHHLQSEKATWEALRQWHIGYGHASVRMRGRSGVLKRLWRVAGQSFTWIWYAPQVLADSGRCRLRPRRKCWQAQGRIEELLRK